MAFKITKNPDIEKYLEVTKAVQDNDNYCPCMLERIPQNKCPCETFIVTAKEGLCHCGRYLKTII